MVRLFGGARTDHASESEDRTDYGTIVLALGPPVLAKLISYTSERILFTS